MFFVRKFLYSLMESSVFCSEVCYARYRVFGYADGKYVFLEMHFWFCGWEVGFLENACLVLRMECMFFSRNCWGTDGHQ